MADPARRSGAPETDPIAELTAEERARVSRRLVHRLLASGIAFLAVVVLGFLPGILAARWPALGPIATVAVWIVAPAIPIGLIVVAALRLRR